MLDYELSHCLNSFNNICLDALSQKNVEIQIVDIYESVTKVILREKKYHAN